MNSSVWLNSLSLLKSRISVQVWETWFSSLKFISATDDQIVFGVPNKFYKEYILKQYGILLEQVVAESSGKRMDIDFIMTGNQAPNTVSVCPKPTGEMSAGTTKDDQKTNFGENKKSVNLIPKYSFENFVIGASNRFAHAAGMAVAESPARAYNPLLIYGGTGLGKTHLMHAIGLYITKKSSNAKILLISCEHFTNQFIYAIQNKKLENFRDKYRKTDVLLLDDVHFIAGKDSTQEEFFHTFNALYDSHKQIVLSSDRHPKDISSLEERLISRFSWGLVTDIQPPDIETRVAILKKKSESSCIFIPDDVVFFVAEKIKVNIRVLEGSLIRVVAYASLMGKKVSIELAREVLKKSVEEKEEEEITLEKIQNVVSNYFGIQVSFLRKKNRQRRVLFPRQVAMYLTRSLTKESLENIGRFFGGKDHTTVLYSYNKIEEDMQKDENVKILINKLSTKIKSKEYK